MARTGRPRIAKNVAYTTITLDAGLAQAIRDRATKRGQGVAALIRDALDDFLATKRKTLPEAYGPPAEEASVRLHLILDATVRDRLDSQFGARPLSYVVRQICAWWLAKD